MWICPKCRHECDTLFCPTCGYEKPNQVSETNLLITKVKKLQKRSNFLTISVIVLLILVVGITAIFGNIMSNLHTYYCSQLVANDSRITNLHRVVLEELYSIETEEEVAE